MARAPWSACRPRYLSSRDIVRQKATIMNRHTRRAVASKRHSKTFEQTLKDLKRTTDIGIDGKDTINGPVVMIFGNTRGRHRLSNFGRRSNGVAMMSSPACIPRTGPSLM